MNFYNHAYRLSVFALFAISISGCSTVVPVQKEIGSLNLQYQTKENGSSTDMVIAIVSPEFVKSENGNAQANQGQQNNLFALMAAQRGSSQPSFSANSAAFSYQPNLINAMQSTLEEMLSKRGFKTKGPYANLDEINYTDKKTMYLIATPKLVLRFDQKQSGENCTRMICTETGSFQISGELTYKLIEPLTGQSMLTKRIDLSSLAISKEYLRQYQQIRSDSEGIAGTLIDKASAPKSISDNTDKVLVDAINEFFQKAMSKIDSQLSRDEILSFQTDINQLKGLKRF